jgi:hypothetical protein
MSSPLEKYILENRSAFDADSPDPRIWEKINQRLEPNSSKKEAPVRSVSFKSWLSIAAAVAVFGLITVIYYSRHQVNPATNLTAVKPTKIDPSSHSKEVVPSADSPSDVTSSNHDLGGVKSGPAEQNPGSAEPEENKEMYYYSKLIELKHEELKTLEKDEPLLYRQFSGDVQKLDSVYHSLKSQLPDNSNREQVMEAMISNLQLQIGLLNKQLDIIKQIKHSKKSAYEKAYKSV